MPSPRLISVGELIDRSWDLYRERFVELMTISGWTLLVAVLDIVALAFYPTVTELSAGTAMGPGDTFGLVLYFFSTYVVAPILSVWVFASIVRMMRARLAGKKTDPRAAMREGWKYFWPSVLIGLMVAAVLIAAMLIGMGPALIIGGVATLTDSVTLFGLGNLLLILGLLASIGLVFALSVWLALANIALLMDDHRGRKALLRSRDLVQGRFWSAFLRLLAPKLLFLLVVAVAMAIAYYAVNMIAGAATGLDLDLRVRLANIAQVILPIVAAALVNPLIIIADTLLYQSLSGKRAK